MTETANKICKRFHAYMRLKAYVGHVHSVFAGAINITTPFGLVTVLSGDRCLGPFSCVVASMQPFTRLNIKEGDEVILANELISFSLIDFEVDVSRAVDMELSLDALSNLFIPIDLDIRMRHLYRVIELQSTSDDMSPLVVEGKHYNNYCDIVAPKLEILHEALREQDIEQAIAVSEGISGLGAGVTPNSDGLFLGYLAGYSAVSLALGRSRTKILDQTRRMASAAAVHTADIAAAFILKGGEGLVSEDIFQLLRCIFSDIGYAVLNSYAAKTATIGTSSGIDSLVGIYLAIQKQYEESLH